MATRDAAGLKQSCAPSRALPHETCPGCGRSFHDEPEGHVVVQEGEIKQYCPDCCPRCPGGAS